MLPGVLEESKDVITVDDTRLPAEHVLDTHDCDSVVLVVLIVVSRCVGKRLSSASSIGK